MEKLLSRPAYREQRRELLRQAEGRVLEIGFGFGGSLDGSARGCIDSTR
jgi:hypothetical protein